jgi:hypothetical protein
MGTYNLLQVRMPCPRCQQLANVELEIHLGDTRGMEKYSIGDRYQWLPNQAVQNGGRPENGNIDGEGYGECPLCDRDFFVKVLIRNDVIQGVEPDFEKHPYIPDWVEAGRRIVREFFAPDLFQRVHILRRSDGLYEVIVPNLGHLLTDTLDNAEKLAREGLMTLTGKPADQAVGRIFQYEDFIPPEPPRFSYATTEPETGVAPAKNDAIKRGTMNKPGEITYNSNWKLTNKRKVALLRLAELGVDVYSSVSSDNFRLLVPFDLHPDVYVEIGYLMAQLGEEADFPNLFHHPISDIPSKLFDRRMGYDSAVSAADSVTGGFRYTVTPKKELKR